MKRKDLVIYVSLLSIVSIVIAGAWIGKLSFGVGLAGMVFLLILSVIFLFYTFFVFLSKWKVWAHVFMLLVVIFYFLSLTILRGAEWPWNGTIIK